MAEDVMLQEAVQAVRQGQRSRARDLFTRLLRADQKNPEYWLWMSSVVETSKEQVYCLQSALRLEPHNQAARQGLVLLGALPPGEAVRPAPPVRRQWKVELREVHEVTRLRALLGNPYVRVLLISLLALALIGATGAFFYNLFKPEPAAVVFIPTRTPGPASTLTSTPTAINFTPKAPTITPTFEAGVAPLWMRLEATYTPTAMYVATRHVANEAYNSALRAYKNGEYEPALGLMRQAAQFDPNAPDIQYYLGEISMAMGEPQQALEAYQAAIEMDASFAPAYLGQARARLAANPGADVLDDLDQALELDPNLVEALLARLEIHLANEDLKAAQADLERLEELAPESPHAALYRAQFLIAEGEYAEALEMAARANERDQTLLPTYLVLGQAALLNYEFDMAREALDVYMRYVEDDPQALQLYGQALYATGQYSDTLQAMNAALELDSDLPEAYYYRGLVYLEMDEGQRAVNEFVLARNLNRFSFDYSLAFGRALLSANRLAEARDQITAAGRLAQRDAEMAQVYYYRALAVEAIGNQPSANQDWQALLELPKEAAPAAWLRAARARLATPTPTPARTPTPKPTK